MPRKQIPIQVRITKSTETISISCVEYLEKFKLKFGSKQAQEYFVTGGQTIVGNNVYLEARSLRVNEFVMMLDDFGIRWKHITESYK